jgi:hypothetical protein
MSAFGAQGGTVGSGYGATDLGGENDPWDYTARPGAGKYRGGTASGGWVIHPPETGPEDATNYGMVPPAVDLSTTLFMVAPGAYFGCGVPELANGSILDGFSWGVDSATGDMVFYSHSNGGAQDEAVRFTNTAQDIGWRSGTDFVGTIAHAITAARTWTLPNKTGTLVLGSAGVAFQVAVWIDTMEISSDANFTFDGTTLGLNAAFLATPSAAQNFVWNEGGVNSDFRVEGDNEPNLFNIDSSDDEVSVEGRFSLRAITPATLTADQNDYSPEGATSRASFWRLSSDALRTITGMAGGLNGRLLIIRNVGSFNIVFSHQDGLSAAANRFIAQGGASLTIAPNGVLMVIYDSTASRWQEV